MPVTEAKTDDGYLICIPESFHGYKFIKILGSGGTSVVCLVKDEISNQLYSAKIIPKGYIKEKMLLHQIKTEISVMKMADHPNIVKFHEHFKIKNEYGESYIVIIMEYCENGDLYTFLEEKRFKNELQKKRIINQFLDAIKYLHKKGIAHGDIKPENILLDSDFNAKLTDFGYSKTKKVAGDESKNGSLYYAAPELFFRGNFDPLKTDIWSIGITLYCLSENNFPYECGDQEFIISQITSQIIYLSPDIPSSLRKVVKRCTAFKPEKRPTIDELMDDDYFNLCENIEDCFSNDDDADFFSSDDFYSLFF